MPRPVEALLADRDRAMSTRSSPIAASAVPRLMAVVVLPTPFDWHKHTHGVGTFFP
jgi:hypothetical protein